MSTYVVRLWSRPGRPLRGRVRHVASGEEIDFRAEADLLAFLEGTHAATGLTEALERTPRTGKSGPDDIGRKDR